EIDGLALRLQPGGLQHALHELLVDDDVGSHECVCFHEFIHLMADLGIGCKTVRFATAATHAQCTQVSAFSPATRANSRRLCVTSVAPSASAWQAIQRS